MHLRHLLRLQAVSRFVSSARPLAALLIALTLAGAAGCGTPSFLLTPVQNTNKLEEEVVEAGKGWYPPKVAVIEVEGLLVNARSGGFLQPTENAVSLFQQEINHAADDAGVKAVVLRVNSPGGTVTASDTMYQILKRFKEKTHKPVVASAQEVVASGAYYVSCGADKIVVQPTSVVGSIGVIFENFNISGTLEKLGARSWDVKSGPLKDMGSPFKPLAQDPGTTSEGKVMQEMVNEFFGRFAQVVTTNRPVKDMPPAIPMPADYAGVFSGRVFSGEKAVEMGLADRTGLLQDAIDLAIDMAHAPGAEVVLYKRAYGYGGSIYAATSTPQPKENVLHLDLPPARALLPTGFYYLWQP